MNAFIRNTLLLLVPAVSMAQTPVYDDGNVVGQYESQADIMPIGDDGIPRLTQSELQELVGPIALYPDDLLAIVLPASAYPLQIVEAARFLEALKEDPTLQPDPDWDDAIIALINYPEVVELLNNDLDWTWRLGEAVVAQQTDVVAAVEVFRDRAYAAGNLKSDSYQTVSRDDGVLSISPTAEDVIYVPYYEPTRVVYYQPRPVYYYYPRPCPVYYYPYAADYYFDRGFFWGVTTAFSIGWRSNSLNVYHHSYRGHPYYGRTYWNDGWYRQPSISVYNTTYVNTTYVNTTNVSVNRNTDGDQWRARNSRREYVRREGYARSGTGNARRNVVAERQQEPITFREREPRSVARTQVSQKRDIPRPSTIDDASNTKRQALTVSSNNERRRPAVVHRSQPTTTTTRRAEASVQRRDHSREAVVRPSRESSATRTERAPTRTERAPTRTERAPVQREPRRTQTRQREQPSRSNESQSRQRSNTTRSEHDSSDRRSRDRNKQ